MQRISHFLTSPVNGDTPYSQWFAANFDFPKLKSLTGRLNHNMVIEQVKSFSTDIKVRSSKVKVQERGTGILK